MPDDQLLAQAANGQLLTETVLAAQVQRMLRDPKATSLVDTFSHQWLRLAKLDEASPSAAIFPSFSEELRTDMKTESRMVIQDMFMRDGSFFELLSLDSTFANQRLAEHYGIAGVTGTQFRKVSLAGTQRAGILTHASLLTANSVSDRTSIIKRGHWVLSNLLCNPPPPPPPDVIGGLPPANLNGITERQRLEAHRSDPACLGCHSKIDPIGFALEGFDGIGKFRTMDNGSPIDSSGEFPDGRKVTGSLQLSTILSEDPRFKLCVAEKLFAYALGRQPEFYDRCTINRIGVEKVAPTQPLSNAILEVIRSDPFRKQRGASVP